MALHFFKNVITEDHAILDEEMIKGMDEFDRMEWIEETNREYSYNEMRLIKRLEKLKRLKKRKEAYWKRFIELRDIPSDDKRWAERNDAFLMSGLASREILEEIDRINIDEYL